MADRMLLKAQAREKVGSNSAAKLRRQGKMPAIVYGHGQKPESVAVDFHDFTEGLHHGHRIFDIDVAGDRETLLVKDLQYDYLGKNVIHADFVRVDMTEKVTIAVELAFKGTAEGTHQGGMVDIHLDEIEVECLVSDIPEIIEVSVKQVNVGDTVHAGDIVLPAGITLKTDPEALVLNCHLVAAAKSTEELEEEMPSAPEVITEKNVEPEAG